MDFEQFNTQRLILRKLDPPTLSHVHETMDNDTLKDFLGLKSDAELRLEKSKYKKGLSTYNRKFLYFQLLDKSNQNIIGWCGYHTWYIDHDRAELGYVMYSDDVKGKGLMSEALSTIIEYGFNTMNLNRIEAFVGKDNAPSLRLMEKMKFSQEGLLRQHYVNKGVAEDSLVFALLRSEYVDQ